MGLAFLLFVKKFLVTEKGDRQQHEKVKSLHQAENVLK